MTALTAALTTGGASGAARTTPPGGRRWRRLGPCSRTCEPDTGWRTPPARHRWLLDGRAGGSPAAGLGAISHQLPLAQGNKQNRRSSALLAVRVSHESRPQEVVRPSQRHAPAASIPRR